MALSRAKHLLARRKRLHCRLSICLSKYRLTVLCCNGVPRNKSCLQANADLKCPSFTAFAKSGGMKCAFLMARGDVFYVCLITSVFALAKEGRSVSM